MSHQAETHQGALDIGEYAFAGRRDKPSTAPLSWRQDPGESLSDWTIVVTCEPPAQCRVKTYHVHKNILATGPKSSEYFEQLFKGGGRSMVEAQTQTSKLEFKAGACEAFPLLLDFLYGLPLAVDVANVVALRSLANYLGAKAAFDRAQSFLQKELNPSNCTTTCVLARYLTGAVVYADEKLEAAMLRLVARGLETIGEGALLTLEPAMLVNIVQSEVLSCESGRLSELVAMYCQGRPDDINQKVLTQLTSASIMPVLKPERAGYLLGLAIQHDGGNVKSDSLRSRCVEAVSRQWETALIPALDKHSQPEAKRRKTDEKSAGEATPSPLSMDVPEEVKLELLAGALRSAHKELADERNRADGERKRADRAEQGVRTELSSLRHSLDSKEAILKRFVRIDKDDDFNGALKEGQSSWRHERASGGRHLATFAATHNSGVAAKYGSDPPSHLPPHDTNKEGFVLKVKSTRIPASFGNGYRRLADKVCPVYYYDDHCADTFDDALRELGFLA